MHAHVIRSIGTLTLVKTKAQVQLELVSYFDELMHILLDESDKGAKAVYPDAIEGRIHFQKDVTTKYTDTIMDYRAWYLFFTIDHHEDVEDLVFPQLLVMSCMACSSLFCVTWVHV